MESNMLVRQLSLPMEIVPEFLTYNKNVYNPVLHKRFVIE